VAPGPEAVAAAQEWLWTTIAAPVHHGDLDVAALGRLRRADAELVYLSACSTSTGAVRQIDESVTVAGAFRLAGFRHVVATLWPLNDPVAKHAAVAFYREMPAAGSADGAAHALHTAVQVLRSAHPHRPDVWAPLIHIGP
jgi:CHAT domain-containing protein